MRKVASECSRRSARAGRLRPPGAESSMRRPIYVAIDLCRTPYRLGDNCETQVGCCERDLLGQFQNPRLLHRGDGAEGLLFRPFTLDPLVHFVQRDRGVDTSEGRRSRFANSSEWGPSAKNSIHPEESTNDHRRSFFSRTPIGRRPRTNPRIAQNGSYPWRARSCPQSIRWSFRRKSGPAPTSGPARSSRSSPRVASSLSYRKPRSPPRSMMHIVKRNSLARHFFERWRKCVGAVELPRRSVGQLSLTLAEHHPRPASTRQIESQYRRGIGSL